MEPFGEPTVVNPFDAFGDRLRVALRTPSLAQLVDWLILPPGARCRRAPIHPSPERGSWSGRRGPSARWSMTCTAVGVPVTVVDPASSAQEGTGPEEQGFADLAAGAVGIVGAADRTP